ncbi:hypothetical protein Pelo_4563 [Pelomyxa schiedti]|nr:hypothetical protein Pelo_4563 [Pelomyxa schiedti]
MGNALCGLFSSVSNPEVLSLLVSANETIDHIITFMMSNYALLEPQVLLKSPVELIRFVVQKIRHEQKRNMAIDVATNTIFSSMMHFQFYGTLVLDLSSPQGFCDSLLAFRDTAEYLGLVWRSKDKGANRFVQDTLLPLKDRSILLKEILRKLLTRWQPVTDDNRSKNPFIFVCGAPGSGKSRMLDEIMTAFETTSSGLDLKVSSGTACTSVTWNGNTPCTQEIDAGSSGVPGLFLRLLFSHWFETRDNFGYIQLFKCISNWDQICVNIEESLNLLIRAMALKSKKGCILVCIDEILKSDDNPGSSDTHSKAICHMLGKLEDTFSLKNQGKDSETCAPETMLHGCISPTPENPVLMTVMSCLNAGWVAELSTDSGRHTIIHKLEPIVFNSRLELFASYKDEYPGVLNGLRKALSDTGGHACLLVGLHRWLIHETGSACLLLQRKMYCLDSIVSSTRSIFQTSTYPYALISAVIKGEPLQEGSMIGDTPFCKLVAKGTIFSTGSIPCLSVMNLLRFAHTYKTPRDPTDIKTVVECLPSSCQRDAALPGMSALLKFMLNPGIDWSNGQALEDFLSLHPLLLTLCVPQGDRTFPLCEMFGNPCHITPNFPQVTVAFPRVPKFLCWNVKTLGNHGLKRTHAFCWWLSKKIRFIETRTVIRCSHTNPGFETVFLLDSSTGKKVVVCLETKFSEPSSTTTLLPSMVREKWDNAKAQTRALRESHTWSECIVVLIVVTLWRIPDDFSFPEDLEEEANIAIVDRVNLVNYLGPTMSSRLDAIADPKITDYSRV